jgi:hypothetical protein
MLDVFGSGSVNSLKIYRSGAEFTHHIQNVEPASSGKLKSDTTNVELYDLPGNLDESTICVKCGTKTCDKMIVLRPFTGIFDDAVLRGKTVTIRGMQKSSRSVTTVTGIVHSSNNGCFILKGIEGTENDPQTVIGMSDASLVITKDITVSEMTRLKNTTAVKVAAPIGLPITASYMSSAVLWTDTYRILIANTNAEMFVCGVDHNIWLSNTCGATLNVIRMEFIDGDQWLHIHGGGRSHQERNTEYRAMAMPTSAATSFGGGDEMNRDENTTLNTEMQVIHTVTTPHLIENESTTSLLANTTNPNGKFTYVVPMNAWRASSSVNYELILTECKTYMSRRSKVYVYEGDTKESTMVASTSPLEDYPVNSDEVVIPMGTASRVKIRSSSIERKEPVIENEEQIVMSSATIVNHKPAAIYVEIRTNLDENRAIAVKAEAVNAMTNKLFVIAEKQKKGKNYMAFPIKIDANSTVTVRLTYRIHPDKIRLLH